MKPFWKSKTIWGVLISALPAILQFVGVQIPGSEAFINELIVAIGSGLAIYGRKSAAEGISFLAAK